MTTAEGTITHSSSVSRATLLYLSSCVGMYMSCPYCMIRTPVSRRLKVSFLFVFDDKI